MSKRKGDSREEEEPKRQKCDITEDEAISDLDAIVVLTDEEELEVLEKSSLLDYSLGSDDGSPSSSDSAESLSVPPTRDAFLNFLRTVSTCKWNLEENARLVFKHLRVKPYVVHPEHFLSKFSTSDYEEDRISNILAAMEKEKKEGFGVPWSKLKKSVEEFLVIYECEGLEELANIHGDRRQKGRALELLTAFKTKIEKMIKNPFGCIYSKLMKILDNMAPGRVLEDFFEEYVRILISFMDGKLSFFGSVGVLTLLFPECKEFKKSVRVVKPDFLLTSVKGERIVLVGEIKTVGSHGRRFESHQGRKLKGAHESSDKRDSEKVEPVVSTSIADTSDETYSGTKAETSDKTDSDGEKTLVEDEEPDHADAVTENKEEKDGRKKEAWIKQRSTKSAVIYHSCWPI